MPVVLIKAINVGTIFDGFGEVDILPVFGSIPAEVPFPDHRGMIARAF